MQQTAFIRRDDGSFEQTMYTTYLASMFRSLRFGINEADGRGVAIQLNYFLDHGGVAVSPDGSVAAIVPESPLWISSSPLSLSVRVWVV